MSIYKRGKTFSVYVPTSEGGRIIRTTGTTDKAIARQIDSMLQRLAGRRDWELLDAIADSRLTVGQLFDGDAKNDLDSVRATLNDIDVSTYLNAWHEAVKARTSKSSDTAQQYMTKLRSLVPEGDTLLRSELTYGRLTEWLSQLSVGPSTKRKYHAAMSSFCEYLLRSEVIAANPMRAVKAPAAGAPRKRSLEFEQVGQLVEAHVEPYKTLCALLHGTGLEISVALDLKAADFDKARRTVRAKGTKTHSRDRVALIADWAWKYIEPTLSTMLPSAKVFPNTDRWRALDALKVACKKIGVEDYRLHDARHTYAVIAIRNGAPFEVVAQQLGHADISQVVKVYGRYSPNDEEKRSWERNLERSKANELRTA